MARRKCARGGRGAGGLEEDLEEGKWAYEETGDRREMEGAAKGVGGGEMERKEGWKCREGSGASVGDS